MNNVEELNNNMSEFTPPLVRSGILTQNEIVVLSRDRSAVVLIFKYSPVVMER
jgi:hypothetical protein